MKATATLAFFLCVAMSLFVAGFLSASALMAKPASEALANLDAPDLWPSSPKPIAAADRGLERVAAAPPVSLAPSETLAQAATPVVADEAGNAPHDASTEIDQTQPGLEAAAMGSDGAATPLYSHEHQAWCAQRYRSYSADDNSYNSYSGERKDCVSPYMDVASTDDTGLAQAAAAGSQPAVLDDQAHRCAERYASYRTSDNTYQPFGGPRRICVLN
jgi:hypothetical protein